MRGERAFATRAPAALSAVECASTCFYKLSKLDPLS